jgi:phosphoribosylglycinamide formyltransferase-1
MKKLAIFASGNGSNAQNIVEYFKNNAKIEIGIILSNKKDAFVLERAKCLHIPAISFNRENFYNSEKILNVLKNNEIDFIILAGFLWLIPDYLIQSYTNKIINIHPALLPKYGGKGMYGDNVHKTVFENKETETGISIHFVSEHYDEGKIIFQAKTSIELTDTPESIAQKVHVMEYEYFPKIIEKTILRDN